MQKPLRLHDQQLDKAHIHIILDTAFHGVLSTVSEDGTPYGVPLNYVRMDDALYFHCSQSGHKTDNILHNPKVSFAVVGHAEALPESFTASYESVIASGTIRLITDAEEKTKAMRLLCQKYIPTNLKQAEKVIPQYLSKLTILEMTMEYVCGKVSE